MPHINVMKDFQWYGIQLCEIFYEQCFLVGRVETSRVGGWCSARKGGHPGALILILLISWIHDAIYFSVYLHVEMVCC